MTISWFGLSSFKITGKDLTIITDPFGSGFGLSPVRGNSDIVICSDPKNPWCNNFSSISGNPFIIDGPGEYDIKGSFIIGTPSDSKNSKTAAVYSIEVDGIRIAFLGPVKISELSDEQKEVFEGSDIILVPVGNKEMMSYQEAAKIAAKLAPYYIIPHSYKIPGVTANLDKIDKFLQEMGSKHIEDDKLSLKKKDLAGDATTLAVLKPQR